MSSRANIEMDGYVCFSLLYTGSFNRTPNMADCNTVHAIYVAPGDTGIGWTKGLCKIEFETKENLDQKNRTIPANVVKPR